MFVQRACPSLPPRLVRVGIVSAFVSLSGGAVAQDSTDFADPGLQRFWSPQSASRAAGDVSVGSSGNANVSYSFSLPAGLLTPQLAMGYSVGRSDDAELGLGWSFSIPFVQLDTSDGVPTYDAFFTDPVTSSSGRLTYVGDDGAGRLQYRVEDGGS